jgi:hypothetical protein
VTAHGAWLHHLGDAVTKEVELAGGNWKAVKDKAHADVAAAYVLMREKWSADLPRDWMNIRPEDFAKLRALPRGPVDALQPPLELDAELCEVIQ